MASVQDGYKKVSGGGQAKTSAPGTETANEGKGKGVPWAKRSSEAPSTPKSGKGGY